MGGRLVLLLAHRRVPWVAAGLTVLLCLPALRAGFVGDDYFHRAILLGRGDLGELYTPLTDLFEFVPRGQVADRLRDAGVVPWWSHPQLDLGFLRPVTALSHMLDYALWPDSPALQHAQSLLWAALAVVLVGALYRRVHGATAGAGLAALLFALEDAHAMPIGWIANRNALIALVFSIPALLAHIRWRRERSPKWLAGSLAALAVALGAGESALGIVAYIGAWQLTMDRGRLPRRIAALLPASVLVIGWRLTYDWMGYGCTGSGLYIDPGRQPMVFAGALLERWPVLLASLWSQISADAWAMFTAPTQRLITFLAVVVCLGVAALSARAVRASREARFWAVGMALALVPMTATFPMNRLLLFAGIGAFGLIAVLVEHAGLLGEPAGRGRTGDRWIARILLLLHVPVAAILLVLAVILLPIFNLVFTAGAASAPRDAALTGQSLIFVNGQDLPCAYTILIRQLSDAEPAPRRVAILAPLMTRSSVVREDDHTIVIDAEDGWLEYPFDRLMRTMESPFAAGDRIETSLFTAEVRRITDDGRPATVAFRFRDPLEQTGHRWVWWQHGRLVDFPMPPRGGAVEIGPESLFAVAASGSEFRFRDTMF